MRVPVRNRLANMRSSLLMWTSSRSRVAGVIACLAVSVVGCTIPVRDDANTSATRTPARTSAVSADTAVPTYTLPPTPSAATSSQSPTIALPTSTVARPAPPNEGCLVSQSGFDCDMQRRIATVNEYLAQRPGTVGFVLRDRQTGAVYRNEYADQPVWTASTIKLAIVVDLLTRHRAGTISLDDEDRDLIQAMLHWSDNDAADTLWERYNGPQLRAFNDAFPQYGLTDLRPFQTYSDNVPYWGFQKCTPADLDRLMQHVLSNLDPADTAYIIEELQNVAENQQWGVWAAGPDAAPGNKDGWSDEDTGWVVNSVGFAGPGQRYTLAIMNSLEGEGGYDDGVTTDSHLAEVLLSGRA